MAKPQVYIVIYSMYHHIYKLAQAVKEGVDATGHAECTIYRVPETLPEEVLTKMHAPPPPPVPVISAADLVKADGIIFGVPTRFGNVPAQMKSFMDSCGQLWAKGELVGKLAGAFSAAATQHGGIESTIISCLSFFAHQGMLYVPVGYTDPAVSDISAVNGGSPWGASTIAGGKGERQPSDIELQIARTQGKFFAQYTAKMAVELK
ncbi:flavodoxin-like protein [Paraphysoderma sedebokerense]|nr:flavodoxin-like protein [Paraphysoderma sedebokerense]KAI9140779.1 flavodoxin-like protein [Paraphysoderma sedebokerense]